MLLQRLDDESGQNHLRNFFQIFFFGKLPGFRAQSQEHGQYLLGWVNRPLRTWFGFRLSFRLVSLSRMQAELRAV